MQVSVYGITFDAAQLPGIGYSILLPSGQAGLLQRTPNGGWLFTIPTARVADTDVQIIETPPVV